MGFGLFHPLRKPSFANSLIIRGALLMLLALTVFAGGSYYFIVRPTVEGLADGQMRLVSQQIEARVEELLRTVEVTLRSSRGWGEDGSLDLDQLPRFNEFFFPIIANHPEITSVNFAHESGREILLLHNADGTWVNRLSNPDQWGRRTYWLFWTATHQLDHVEERILDYDSRKRPWNKGAMALEDDHDIFWTQPYVFFTTKDPGITASMRWKGKDGSRFVIGHDVRLLELSRFTSSLTVGQRGRATLLHQDGQVLAPPHEERFSSVSAIQAAVLKKADELGLRDVQAGVASWADAGRPQDSIGNFALDGERWFSLFHPVSVGKQTFWLGVFAPEAEFFPTTGAKLAALGAIALLALLAGVFVSMRIARRFGRPLVQLAKESIRIGRMELDAPVQVNAPWWEITQLADAQETMRIRLKEANQSLEAKVAERTAELERQFSLMQALIDTIPNPIFYKGPDTRFLGCNWAYEQAFGIRAADLVGKCTLDLTYHTEADRQAYQADSERVIAEAGRVSREVRMTFADGSIHDVLYSATGFVNRDGSPGGMVGVVVDISMLKNAERDAQRARAAAEAAASAKADFLANMSHEIRTPMNAIIGLTHIALQTELTAKQRGYLEKVESAGKSLLGIVNDILDFSKIEAGMMPIELTDFSLGHVLGQVADLLAPKAAEKRLALQVDCASDVPDTLVGDPLRIQQILLNLVGNALKFTSQGSVSVAVRLASATGMPLRLRFEVTDTGIGMTPEEQQRLFAPFTQADTSTTRRYGGTGLGLSICKRLVELMNGEIGVTSESGQGSCFFFELPLAAGSGQIAPTGQSHSTAADLLRGKRVLLVEDNEVNREMAEEILRSAGLEVDTAVNGMEAVELATGGYDAILMDCNMPLMDGFEATRRIRAGRVGQDVPILAMTASVLLGDRELCMAAGMNDHVSKPIDVDELFDKLAKWTHHGMPVQLRPATGNMAVASGDGSTGIDRSSALKRLGGNEALYQRLLDRFAENQAMAVESIRTALAAGERETAQRHAHTLKGLAGNIGADALMSAAADVEHALAAGGCDEGALTHLASLLAQALADLPQPVARSGGISTSAPMRKEDLVAQLHQLQMLLTADNAESANRFDLLKPALAGFIDQDSIEALAHAIGQYEFDAAAARVGKLMVDLERGSTDVNAAETTT